MLHTFGTFKCFETENIEVVLEIMKLYNSSLNKYFDKLNLSKIKILLKEKNQKY